MEQNNQEQASQNQTDANSTNSAKNGTAAKNADMTKGHDGAVNQHKIKADKKAAENRAANKK